MCLCVLFAILAVAATENQGGVAVDPYYDEQSSSTATPSQNPSFEIQYGIGQISCARVVDQLSVTGELSLLHRVWRSAFAHRIFCAFCDGCDDDANFPDQQFTGAITAEFGAIALSSDFFQQNGNFSGIFGLAYASIASVLNASTNSFQ